MQINSTILKKYLPENTYIVGGALRDFLLKRPIKDIDFIIDTKPENLFEIIKVLSKKINASIFALDEERSIWRISFDEINLDFSPLEKSLDFDLKKRDFTINSLALKLNDLNFLKSEKTFFKIKINKNKIIDKTNGIKDLNKKIIKEISSNIFKEDPLRMLRAFRFASVYNFKLNSKILNLIKKNSKLIKDVSGERVRDELLYLFSENSYFYFSLMAKYEILFSIFPDLKAQEKCAEIYYGKGGVLKHTLTVLKRMDLLLKKPQKFISNYNLFKQDEHTFKLLKLSALLHDIAKPNTAKIIKDRLRFFAHEEVGGRMSYQIMKNLKFSNEDIRLVTKIISQHLRIGNIAHSEIISQKAMFKIFSEFQNYTPSLLLLSWADHSSYIKEKEVITLSKEMKKKPFKIPSKGLPKTGVKKTLRFIQVVNLVAKNYVLKKDSFSSKPLLDGNEIMKILNINSGPKVGEILKRLKFMQFQNKIKNRKEAENYIKTLKLF